MHRFGNVAAASAAATVLAGGMYSAACSTSTSAEVSPVTIPDAGDIFIDGGEFPQAVPSGQEPRDCGAATTPVQTSFTVLVPNASPVHLNEEVSGDGGLLDADVTDIGDAASRDGNDSGAFRDIGAGSYVMAFSSGNDQTGLPSDVGMPSASLGVTLPIVDGRDLLSQFAVAQAASALRTTYSESLMQLDADWLTLVGQASPNVAYVSGISPYRSYTFVLGINFPTACAKAAFGDVIGVDAPVAQDVLSFSTSPAVSDVLVKNGVSFSVAVLTNVNRAGIVDAVTDAQSKLCGASNLGACLRLVNALHDEVSVVGAEPAAMDLDAISNQTDPSWSAWTYGIQAPN